MIYGIKSIGVAGEPYGIGLLEKSPLREGKTKPYRNDSTIWPFCFLRGKPSVFPFKAVNYPSFSSSDFTKPASSFT